MKSKQIISNFFQKYFKKYPEIDSFWFLIYNNGNEKFRLADEDVGINDLRWDELSDRSTYESSYKIQEAIEKLNESSVKNLDDIKNKLTLIWQNLQKQAYDNNPLNKVLEDIWSDKNREKLTKKVKKSLEKEILWKYVSWCKCTVKKDGNVDIKEFTT